MPNESGALHAVTDEAVGNVSELLWQIEETKIRSGLSGLRTKVVPLLQRC
jgi:hypothetical protein